MNRVDEFLRSLSEEELDLVQRLEIARSQDITESFCGAANKLKLELQRMESA